MKYILNKCQIIKLKKKHTWIRNKNNFGNPPQTSILEWPNIKYLAISFSTYRKNTNIVAKLRGLEYHKCKSEKPYRWNISRNMYPIAMKESSGKYNIMRKIRCIIMTRFDLCIFDFRELYVPLISLELHISIMSVNITGDRYFFKRA